jgi:hypothetical protein
MEQTITADDLPPLLTVREAARLCGLSHTAAYAMDKRGELPTLGTGSRRVLKAQLLGMLEIDAPAATA